MANTYQAIMEIVENFILPGRRYIYSSFMDLSVQDLLINTYGEDWRFRKHIFNEAYISLKEGKSTFNENIPYFCMMYYLPEGVAKIQIVLLELLRKKKLAEEIKILDVGGMFGSTLFAMMDTVALMDNLCTLTGQNSFFNNVVYDWIGDLKHSYMEVYNDLFSYYKSKIEKFLDLSKFRVSEPKCCDFHNLDIDMIEDEYDIIVFADLLNGFTYNERINIIEFFDICLKDNGHMIIIESAERRNVADLNRLKHYIVNELGYTCIGPCGAGGNCVNCWNYRTESLVKSGTYKYIVEEVLNADKKDNKDNKDNKLEWSYYILCKDKGSKSILAGSDIYFVISEEKDNMYYICNSFENKINKLVLGNYDIKRMRYGDIICIKDATQNNDNTELYLTENTQISVVNYEDDEPAISLRYKNIEENAVLYIVSRIWGFSKFREGQFEIIKNALLNVNVLGILPTGAGKSLCFQLPAMMNLGVSIVISPLKSLMKDQIQNLRRYGFEFVDYIDSSRTSEEKNKILLRFKRGYIKSLYVTPERIQITGFQEELFETLSRFSIDYFIIDEAHCASEWGHDFRPSYLKLIGVVKKLNNPTIIAVTATASKRVKEDILEIFELKNNSAIITAKSLDRPEISLSVIKVGNDEGKNSYLKTVLLQHIPQILGENCIEDVHKRGTGIIFTIYAQAHGRNTRKYGTEYINELVKQTGINSRIYHSKLDDDIRMQIQEEYCNNKFPLLVSTKGFGMGIDKPDIDYIIHMCYSNSLEAYYQEAGRAGRDGEHAHSVIIAKDRHPQCIRESKRLGNYAPRCADGWTCFYTLNSKCDYGMQAHFIESEYPNETKMKDDLEKFIDDIRAQSEGRQNFVYFVTEKDSKKAQRYLFYLQKEGFILDYSIEEYTDNGLIMRVSLAPWYYTINEPTIVRNIVRKLQAFKNQKYAMLANIWEYVDNESICRRQFIMDYFGESVDYHKGCGFCDIEGISQERAIQFTPSKRVQLLYDELHQLLDSRQFVYDNVLELQKKAYEENVHENIKIRAMRYLEDYPDNIVALYLSGIITIKRDSGEVYGKNQLFNCVRLLFENNYSNDAIKVLYEVAEVSPEIVFEILVTLNLATFNVDLLQYLIEKLNNHDYKKYLFYSYLHKKLSLINKTLMRR